MLSFFTISAVPSYSKTDTIVVKTYGKPKHIVSKQIVPKLDLYCAVSQWTKSLFCTNYSDQKKWYKIQVSNVDFVAIDVDNDHKVCAYILFSKGNPDELPAYTTKCFTIQGNKFNGTDAATQIPK
eukprot:NODE_490_length_6857_cov_0.383249.p9 type:complete len:125 gc:universal NODE_490_length_6857_cov_0.383249:2547-2921(+)